VRSGDLDAMAVDHARAAAHDRRAGAFEKLAVHGVEPRDLDAAVGLQRLPVERGRVADAPAEARRFLEALVVVRGEAVELLRNATDVDASAAERGVLRDGDARAALRRQPAQAHAAAAGADDEEVEVAGGAHRVAATLISAPSATARRRGR
jgi:hypothetical protein